MITIFNRRELLVTFSIEEQSNIMQILSQNNLDYYLKVVNRLSPSILGAQRGRRGSFGQNMNYNYEYIFYVHKKDYDTAKHIISK